MIKRLTALFVLLSLLLTGCSGAAELMPQIGQPDRPQTAGSSLYTLSVNEETCTVSVVDKQGEVVLSTNPEDPQEDAYTPAAKLNNVKSQLIVTYYDELNVDSTIGSYVSSVKRNTAKISKKSDYLVRIDYDFSRKNEQFIIPVEYRLEEDCLHVRVLTEEIQEYGNKKISRIAVTPFMVRGTAEDDGYLLLPDGSGATVDFSYVNPDAAAYSAQIFGSNGADALYYETGNSKTVMLPIFGADYGNFGVLAEVDGNPSAGWITAYATGADTSYAYCYATFEYRIFDTVTITGSDWQYKEYVTEAECKESYDFSVSYHITSRGGLSSLADKYRQIKDLGQQRVEEALSMALYAYGITSQKAAFMGVPYTKTVAATTFDDVQQMLDQLTKDNRTFAVLLQDFDKNTLKDNYLSNPNIKWDSHTGGKKAYTALKSRFEKVQFYSVQNLLYENCDSLVFLKQHKFAKMVSKENLARYTYSPVTYAHQRSDDYALTLEKLMAQAEQALTGDSNCGIALRYFGSELYSDCNISSGTCRQDYLNGIELLLREKQTSQNLAVDGGNEYTLKYGDIHYNMPVTSSAFALESLSVPFVQMVYHGSMQMVSSSINMMDDPEKELLWCIASGTVPCYAVTGTSNEELRRSDYKDLIATCFDVQKDEIADILNRTEGYYNQIFNQMIVSFENVNGLTVTTYENGVRAIVNFTNEVATYEGQQINAMDFAIIL